MFYFKFYDQSSSLIPANTDYLNDYSIDPNDMSLSYIPWKGTTYSRKTMLENQIQYIPREFVKKLEIERPDEVSQSRINLNSNSSMSDDEHNFGKTVSPANK